jgi:type IV pilus assembly protein PilM
LFRRKTLCTGIDLGTGSVKLVRGEGQSSLQSVTHVGLEELDSSGPQDPVSRLAEALSRLLKRVGLNKGDLGSIAVNISRDGVSLREVVLPSLRHEDLLKALPFEARKHLFMENIESPIFDFQELGPAAPTEEGGTPGTRVLLVAASKPSRDLPVQVLKRLQLEPKVVDIDSLAGLNTLLSGVSLSEADSAMGLLDLGVNHSQVSVTHPMGGLLTRRIGPGVPEGRNPQSVEGWIRELVSGIRETSLYYRGRHRQDMGALFVAGGGALVPGMVDRLSEGLGFSVSILDPLKGLAPIVEGVGSLATAGPRFVTAYGLCVRWSGSVV